MRIFLNVRFLIEKMIDTIKKFFEIPKFKQNFHKHILKKGIFFTILFYALLFLFFIEVLVAIFFAILSLKYLALVFVCVLLLILGFYLKKRNLYSSLFLLFAWSPFSFIFLLTIPLFQIFANLGNLLAYIIISVHSLILGILIYYMFNKVSKNKFKHMLSSVKYSMFLAFVFANNALIRNLLKQLEKLYTLNLITESSVLGLPALFRMFNTTITNPHIGFALSFLFFNIPFALHYGKNHKKILLWHLVPVFLYVFLAIGLNIMVKTFV